MKPHVHSNRDLPRRIDSLAAAKSPYFAEVEEQLRDIKRVNTQGQEEDLRMALSRMISRVEELTSMLKEAFKAQTDLQTELTLAKSNLQLALANNEMLEDALKRTTGGHVKDIGWRRWSAREQKEREAEEDRRRSMDSAGSFDTAQGSPIPHPSPMPPSPLPGTASVVSPVPSSDGRFFKFRFGSGSAAAGSFPSSPRLAVANGSKSPLPSGTGSHLTSASLPSLVPDREKEIEDLNAELKRERDARKAVIAQKEALEAELESLSQALFEEANKMVSTERKKLAETEDELKELQAEREALRNALRLVERQSRYPDRAQSGDEHTPGHAHAPSTSSARAVKSLPSTRPSSPDSGQNWAEDDPSSAGTVIAASSHRPPPLMLDAESPLVSSSPPPDETLQHPISLDSSRTRAELEESLSQPISVRPSSVPSPSPSIGSGMVRPSPSPSPSIPSPDVGDYVYPLMRPVDYLPGELSPWADAKSFGSPRSDA